MRSAKNVRMAALLFAPALVLIPRAALATKPAVAQLGEGVSAYDAHNLPAAIALLHGVAVAEPLIADYATFYLASAEEQSGDFASAIEELNRYRTKPIASSPLAGKISLLHAKALLDQRDPGAASKALNILQADYKLLPQPDGDFEMGLAYEALNERQQAAMAYQKVFYAFPNTDLAAQAWTGIDRLQTALGSDFPKPAPKQQLDRCKNWLNARQFLKARQEYEQLAQTLPDADRDEAKVGIGAAEYLSGDYRTALRYLDDLHVARSEADAERLYYITETARKTGDDARMMAAVMELGEHYEKSVWRLKALITAGNRYLLTNDRDKYTPLFRAASDTFPADNATAYCHWKVTWDAWLGDKPERETLLKEQVERYPNDVRASTALYFLGRLAEKDGKAAEAKAWYERVSAQYPHYFYGVLARERLAQTEIAGAAPDESVKSWLQAIDWPEQRDLSAVEPNDATTLRIERARLLTLAGLPDQAESELRFGAKAGNEQPALLAVELARMAPSPFRALRAIKSFSGDYLALPIDKAPMSFWQMLFPLPYRDEVVRNAREHGLDPYQVAALIRQESEFNPGAKSHANAYGLMQLIPSTGRLVGRREGFRRVRAASLLNPGLNIRLGTGYLRTQLDNWSGNWTQTLAAYNAGPGRVHEWLSWNIYREPAEFVESIPFSETREYVQAVLRNTDMYREIYGNSRARTQQIAASSDAPPAPPRLVRTVAATAVGAPIHRAVLTVAKTRRGTVRQATARKSSQAKHARTSSRAKTSRTRTSRTMLAKKKSTGRSRKVAERDRAHKKHLPA